MLMKDADTAVRVQQRGLTAKLLAAAKACNTAAALRNIDINWPRPPCLYYAHLSATAGCHFFIKLKT